MDISYEDMKDMMRILDNNDIPYKYGNYYNQEFMPDGSYKDYIEGHYIKLFDKVIDCWEIDDADDRWNRG